MRLKEPLSLTHPAIAEDWHPTANGAVRPEQVSATSKFKATWVCRVDPAHETVQRVDYRVIGGGCQSCKVANKLKDNNLLVKYPDVARQWHPTKNGELRPDQVMSMSHTRAWWQCDNHKEHVWYALISNRTKVDAGCPFCAGHQVDSTNSFVSRYPEVAKQWHPTKNGKLTPDLVTYGSMTSVWWLCDKGHSWQAVVNNRPGNDCPKCTGRFLSDETRLSVQYPEIAAEWHPTKNRRLWPTRIGNFKAVYNYRLAPDERDANSKRRLLPSDVISSSYEEIWWQCSKRPDHVWRAMVWLRTQEGQGCPFCSGRSVNAENNLAVLYPSLAKQWHSRNAPLLPTQVTPSSKKSVWWRCFKNAEHLWESRVVDVVEAYDKGESGCARCRALKGQDKLSNGKRKSG